MSEVPLQGRWMGACPRGVGGPTRCFTHSHTHTLTHSHTHTLTHSHTHTLTHLHSRTLIQVKGLVGIAADPDFTTDVVLPMLTCVSV